MNDTELAMSPPLSAVTMVTQSTTTYPTTHSHELKCMEIWNGNRFTESVVTSAGMRAWVFSQPFQGEAEGGDIHYLTQCAGGVVTRIALADVSGHGDRVAKTSEKLRNLLRRFMNAKKQSSLVSALNRQFANLEFDGSFATAVVASYLSHKKKLLLTNAGHPRPLLYKKSLDRWVFLDEELNNNRPGDNFPLGMDHETTYQHFVLKIEPDDLLLLYTDAYTEICDVQDRALGENGLIRLVRQISPSLAVTEFGRKLNRLVSEHASGVAHEDDATLIVIQFNNRRRRPGLIEKVRGYIKVIPSLMAMIW